MVRQGQVFVEGLAARVGPAQGGGGAVDAVVVLGEGGLGALAVDLAGGGDEGRGESALFAGVRGGEAQQGRGLLHIGLDGLDGPLDDAADAHGRGQMVNLVESTQSVHLAQGRGEVGADQPQVRVPGALGVEGEVRETARGEVVDDRDAVAAGQKFAHEVRADEPGASGDQ